MAARWSRRRFLQRSGYVGLGLAAWAACGGGDDPPAMKTTLDRTILVDETGSPVYGPGEAYVVRTDLVQAQAERESRRRSLLAFHHLSDFRIVDEESPLRSEWIKDCPAPPAGGAFRPQETLSVQAAAALIAAANAVRASPVTGRAVDFAVHTGNAADNSQFNELRWFVDLMDGKPVYPDAGAIGYQGVQTESPAPAYGDVLQIAQRPFSSAGLRYPWYAVVGNRDILAQGNFAASEAAQGFATGAQKIMALGPSALESVCAEPPAVAGPDTPAAIFGDPETVVRGVGSDPNRRLLSLKEWTAEHFASEPTPGPEGHGFTPEAYEAGRAYYVIERDGIALIVLNSVNPAGFSAGSIDAAQFRWLEEQLAALSSVYFDAGGQQATTQNADSLIVIACHHPLEAMNNPFPGPDAEPRVQGPDLEALLHRFPNVVLYVAGHTLEGRVAAKPDPSDRTAGFWQVTTGGSLDYPMQGRLIEVTDNRDGTLSIFSTMYDSAAPLNPGDAVDPTPEDGINQMELGAIAREAALRDPRRNADAAGMAASDRNAEMLIAAPFDTSWLPTATLEDERILPPH